MELDISDTLPIEELSSLEPYLLMFSNATMTAKEHNDAVLEAYLLGKIERENV